MLNEEYGLTNPFSFQILLIVLDDLINAISNLIVNWTIPLSVGNTACNCVLFVKTIHTLVDSSELWRWALALSSPIDCQPRIFSGFGGGTSREPVLSGGIQRE